MTITWNEDQPIYRQLVNRVVSWILEGRFADGDALPSIRAIASEFDINPLTASKAYQELANIKVVERRRGIGLFIQRGARARLMRAERDRFLGEEWPEIVQRVERMGLDPGHLMMSFKAKPPSVHR